MSLKESELACVCPTIVAKTTTFYPTLADAAKTDLVYRLNTGPTGEAVTMCANCEIAMQTN